MANESSSSKNSTSSSSPPSSTSSADSYIGSFISLTSKYEIRYEGVLYYLNPQDSTLGLKNVKSYGTEGRKKDGPQIPPSDKVYEYILFRGNDIKDLQVKSSRPSQVEEPIHNDPAIIQSQFVTGHSSSSKSLPVSGGSLTEISACGEASALSMKSYPSGLSSRQSGVHIVEQGPPQMSQSANLSSYATPTYWQGYNGITSGNVYAQQHHPSPATSLPSLPNFSEASLITAPVKIPSTSSSVYLHPIPSTTVSNSVHPNIISCQPSHLPVLPPMNVHSFSAMSAVSAQPNVLTANLSNLSSFPPTAQNVNKLEQLNTGKVFSDSIPLHTAQPLSYSATSVADSSLGPILKQTPILLTPDQLSQSVVPEYTPQILYPNQKDVGVVNMASSSSLSSVTNHVNQAPLLPLEPPGQQFTEEFDFEAMNEKFKKDEVWGYLGKAKQKDTAGTVQDNNTMCQTSGEVEGDGFGLTVEADSKPAYNKDDFFDSISCNTTAHRNRNGQIRFTERMKLDTETFGQFPQRTHPVHGGYGPGHGMNRNQYGYGRGYNSGSRVRGGYMQY